MMSHDKHQKFIAEKWIKNVRGSHGVVVVHRVTSRLRNILQYTCTEVNIVLRCHVLKKKTKKKQVTILILKG